MRREEKEQEVNTARELDEIQIQWEKRKNESKGAERKRIAKEQGKVHRSSQNKKKKDQGEEEQEKKRFSKRRKYELVGAKWGKQMNNLLLNRSREPIPTEGAETLVQGALTPLLPPVVEIGSKSQTTTPREQQAKMADPPPPQIQMRSVSPPPENYRSSFSNR